MKKRKIALRNFALLAVLLSSFIACDKDFANIDSDIINNDNATHFQTRDTLYNVIAFTKALDPVQTNALPLNILGDYHDPTVSYGNTTSSFVSQISSGSQDPDFGVAPVIDSVVLTIPYFSTPTAIDAEGVTTYELDSIFGNGSFNFSIYESNYFLRDFDPTASDINSPQSYYANKSTGSNIISDSQLEGPLLFEQANFLPLDTEIELWDEDDAVTSRLAPSLRIKFDADIQQYWQEKIIDMAGQPELSNINNFNNYFRGIYFKAEPSDSPDNLGKMMLLNMVSNAANITIYYTRDPFTAGADRVQTTYTYNFTGNRVNFISNDFSLSNGDEINGDENLYLKGGQGSIAEIKLFNGDDIDENADTTFETFKNKFVETDEDGNFVSSKRLINEANLVFYVNQDEVNADGDEPNRVYLYDMNNNIALADYFFDTANTVAPEFSRSSHLVPLERENNVATGDGIRYKIRITEHLNNLILRDSTNVKLGLAVSANVNLEGSSIQYDLLSVNDDDKVPVSSILTPRGTVLHGNTTADEDKKLYLEIFFTEPNN